MNPLKGSRHNGVPCRESLKQGYNDQVLTTFKRRFKDALAVSQLENTFNLNDFINKMKKYGFTVIDNKFTKDYTLPTPLINLQFIKNKKTSNFF